MDIVGNKNNKADRVTVPQFKEACKAYFGKMPYDKDPQQIALMAVEQFPKRWAYAQEFNIIIRWFVETYV
jgi:hypothetical protein